MRNLRLSFVLTFAWFSISAQDTVYAEKKFNHEIGFNSVTLLRQIVVFSPGTAEQLPFDLFYNLYWKDRIGLRVGLGILSNVTETTIQGQAIPRHTQKSNMNVRAGLSYNFIRHRRLTLNCFADYLHKNSDQRTITTTTTQVFPNPASEQTIESTEITTGMGAQAGIGVKYNIYRHLALYIEVPLSFMYEEKTVSDLLRETGIPDQYSRTQIRSTGTKIALPTTVYIVLRF